MQFLIFLIFIFGLNFLHAQIEYGRHFWSLDAPFNTEVSFDGRLRQLDDKLTNHFTQQIAFLKERIEQLEESLLETKQANTYDWKASDSGSLYKIFTEKKTWDEAQSICKKFGARLAIVDSQFKNNFIQEMISSKNNENDNEKSLTTNDPNDTTLSSTTISNDYDLGFWIGLKTKAEMSSSNSKYSNFYENQSVDGCTVIDGKGKWKIRSCQSQRGFVCQQVNVRRR